MRRELQINQNAELLTVDNWIKATRTERNWPGQ